jgi:uncharacterized protein (DUF1778 family)
MSTCSQAYERIDLHNSPEIKDLIVRAASSAGMTVSAFLLGAAQERAKQVLAEAEMVTLTAGDWRAFAEALDAYLKWFARQHAETNISRTYVAVSGSTVLGFYSLAMSGIRRGNLPEKYAPRFPNFPFPVARLAVDLKHQRQGLCELLPADTLQRCLHLSESIGMLGVIVDAKDSQARGWYERYEFERLPDAPLALWLPTAALAKIPAEKPLHGEFAANALALMRLQHDNRAEAMPVPGFVGNCHGQRGAMPHHKAFQVGNQR